VWEQRYAPRNPCVPEAHASARAEDRCRGGFLVWCCRMSSAGGCPGHPWPLPQRQSQPRPQFRCACAPSIPLLLLARGSPEAMSSLYRPSDLAKSSPVPTASTRCSAKPGRIEPSSSVRCPKRGTVSPIPPTKAAKQTPACRGRPVPLWRTGRFARSQARAGSTHASAVRSWGYNLVVLFVWAKQTILFGIDSDRTQAYLCIIRAYTKFQLPTCEWAREKLG